MDSLLAPTQNQTLEKYMGVNFITFVAQRGEIHTIENFPIDGDIFLSLHIYSFIRSFVDLLEIHILV